MESFASIPSAVHSSVQNFETNKEPLSDTMSAGSPCLANTCLMNKEVNSFVSSVVWQGINIPCFVRRSTTTRIALNSSFHFLEAALCDQRILKTKDVDLLGVV